MHPPVSCLAAFGFVLPVPGILVATGIVCEVRVDIGDVCLDEDEIIGIVLVGSIPIEGKIEVLRGEIPKRRQRFWNVLSAFTPFIDCFALCGLASFRHLISLPIKYVKYHGDAKSQSAQSIEFIRVSRHQYVSKVGL
jgi:hypothetical protein